MPAAIRSRLNEETGWLSVWREPRDESAPAAEVAEAFHRFVKDSGHREAVIGSETTQVAAALVKFPGFSFLDEDYRYTRPWPSGVARPDMTGVRAAKASDAETVARIITSCVRGVAPSWVKEDMFGSGWYNVLVSDGSGDVAFGSAIHDGGEGIVNWICVLPRARRRGIGTRLMEILLAELDSVPHEVLALNVGSDSEAAIRLYEKFGFARSAVPFVNVKYDAP